MTTTDNVKRWREAHYRALLSLSNKARPNAPRTGLQIWRALRRVEAMATKATTAYCNGEIDEVACDEACRFAAEAVARIFGGVPAGFFVNRDPRGYALKLDNEVTTIPDGMHKDWGGYGILAATIDD